jgi:hypothetical protein
MIMGTKGFQAVLLAAGWLAMTATCSQAARVQVTGSVDDVEVTDYGIYTSEKAAASPQIAGIVQRPVDNVELIAITNTVPAQRGINFGFRYRLVGEPLDSRVTVRIDTIFPPAGIMSPKAGLLHSYSYSVTDHIGVRSSFAGYSADEAWELVPGTWTMQLWVGDKKFAEQSFTMLPPRGPTTVAQQSGTN